MVNLKKIVIIGPESTGKSTLCHDLAQHYNTVWCKEYAREYLEKNGTNYYYEDLLNIAIGQIKNEEEAIENCIKQKQQLLFIDTDLHVMKVWCEYVYNKCHQYILDEIATRKYDLYLLCNIDLPWVKDELREYENIEPRKELFNIYKDILINQKTTWVVINGNNEQRLQNAIEVVNNHINL